MLIRLTNWPPRIAFITLKREEIGRFAGRADLADGQDRLGGGRLVDQVDRPARRRTPDGATDGARGTGPGAHVRNRASSAAVIASGWTSPTTTSAALPGTMIRL